MSRMMFCPESQQRGSRGCQCLSGSVWCHPKASAVTVGSWVSGTHRIWSSISQILVQGIYEMLIGIQRSNLFGKHSTLLLCPPPPLQKLCLIRFNPIILNKILYPRDISLYLRKDYSRKLFRKCQSRRKGLHFWNASKPLILSVEF